MKEKILDHEIEEILREKPRNLTSLSEIINNLESNRKIKRKTSVSKTTVYSKLEKMVSQKKIYHINRKGYKLLKYKLVETDPNFHYFEIYKDIIDIMGLIWITKGGKLEEVPEVLDNFKDYVTEELWEDFKHNYKGLIEQGILEIKPYHKKFGSILSVSYYWALHHNLCPICLKTIDLNAPHFALEFVEEEVAYIEFAKTHIRCIDMILDRYELKKEYEGEIPKYDPYKEFNFDEISKKYVGITCPYCGLTTDLYILFFDELGPLESIYKEFKNKNMGNLTFRYIQNLCKELYGDFATLVWAKKIRFKKVRLVIKKVVMLDGVAYHPNCVIKKYEEEKKWESLVNKQNKEEICNGD